MVRAAPAPHSGGDARRLVATLAALAGLTLLIVVAGLPWLDPRFDWEAAADAPNHLLRIYAISHALSEGSLYPRWLPDLYLGYGYPLLNFYAPAAYYLGAALHSVGLTVYAALQWSGIAALALGAVGTFLLGRALSGGSLFAGALATLTYVCAPYPFLTNLYVRAAIPEALALGLLPWLLLAVRRAVFDPSRRAAAVLAMAVALLLLTHNVTALLGLPLAALFAALLLLVSRPTGSTLAFRTLLLGAGLGLALAAFFWLPAVAESRYVQLDLLRGGIYDFHTWLFDPLRIGPTQPSLIFDYSALGLAAPERISPWQALLWAATCLVCASRVRRPAGQFGLALCVLSFACWFFATTWSIPIWDRVPVLTVIQFPWRLYGPLALLLSLAAACGVPGARFDRPVATLPLMLLSLGMVAGAITTRPTPLSGSAPARDVDADALVAKEVNRYGMGTTSGGEFLPRSVGWPVEGSTRRGIKLYEDAYPQASWQAGFARLLTGRAAITQIYRDQAGIAAYLQAETPSQLALHQLAFPGWRAFLDGAPAPIRVARYEPFDASLGFIVVDVPSGNHHVEIRYGPTRIRHVANALSAAAVIVLTFGAVSGISSRPTAPFAITTLAALASLTAVLAGELHARAGATIRPSTAHVVTDVLGGLSSGGAEARTPAGAGQRLFPPFLDRQYKWIRGDERRWLYMHPPSDITLRARIPARAYLQTALAIDPAAWSQPVGDGVRFLIEADSGAGWITVLDRHLHPRARGEDQGWIDVWIPLDRYARQEITLRLRTEHGADPNFDWSGWANPQIVTHHTSRPHPGEPHKW